MLQQRGFPDSGADCQPGLHFPQLHRSKTFVTFREELAFSKKYLSLLIARYGDLVSFRYDFDSALLNYGIIRNVFQLLIENYFVHGFDANRPDNEIEFMGTFLDEDNIQLLVRITAMV